MAKKEAAAPAELTITEELLEATGIEAFDDDKETGRDFLRRLCESVSELPDKRYTALSDDARGWAEIAIAAFNKAEKEGEEAYEEVPELDGVSASEEEAPKPAARTRTRTSKPAAEPAEEKPAKASGTRGTGGRFQKREAAKPAADDDSATIEGEATEVFDVGDAVLAKDDEGDWMPATITKVLNDGAAYKLKFKGSDDVERKDADDVKAKGGSKPAPAARETATGKPATGARAGNKPPAASKPAPAAKTTTSKASGNGASGRPKMAGGEAPSGRAGGGDSTRFRHIICDAWKDEPPDFDKLVKTARKQGIVCDDSQLQRVYAQAVPLLSYLVEQGRLGAPD